VVSEQLLLEVAMKICFINPHDTIRPDVFGLGYQLDSKGHEWKATVDNRSNGTGCPYCSGRLASDDNCLQNLNPKLAKEWHLTKNLPLTSRGVKVKSARKVWWVCKEGHEWEALVYSRSRGRGCPYCARQRRQRVINHVALKH